MATTELRPEEEAAEDHEVVADSNEIVALVQELQERFERSEDSESKRSAEALIGALVQMYGSGLERVVALLVHADGGDERLRAALERDPLLGTLLLIHDLHPATLSERVAEALEQVRPYMESHGGNVELLSLEHGVARIRLQGSCSDCAASAVTLELAIKQALEDAAPDLEGLEVEGVAPPPEAAGAVLPVYQAGPAGGEHARGTVLPMAGGPGGAQPPGPPMPAWRALEDVGALASGEMVAADVAGASLLVANVDGTLLAYVDRCAACGSTLAGGELSDGALRCPECARTFFLPRAGRSLDGDHFQLEPVPLLAEGGSVKVALAR